MKFEIPVSVRQGEGSKVVLVTVFTKDANAAGSLAIAKAQRLGYEAPKPFLESVSAAGS